jgi:hypothetical protein
MGELMTDVAIPDVVSFIENSARLRAMHYREEAVRFRTLAGVEPVAKMRRHLLHLAALYSDLASEAEIKE